MDTTPTTPIPCPAVVHGPAPYGRCTCATPRSGYIRYYPAPGGTIRATLVRSSSGMPYTWVMGVVIHQDIAHIATPDGLAPVAPPRVTVASEPETAVPSTPLADVTFSIAEAVIDHATGWLLESDHLERVIPLLGHLDDDAAYEEAEMQVWNAICMLLAHPDDGRTA